MSNSSLISYTKISPNRSCPRANKIDTISIHCMVGQLSVEGCGSIFSNSSAQASSNYGIGSDGRIAMYVEECDRSWCTSSRENDNRAITIECASDTTDPYAVNDKVYESLIQLCTDICKRNGIKKLVWSTNKYERVNHLNGCNMTVHRDYAYKACPGDYLYNRMGDIAAQVNKKLGEASGIVEGWKQDKTGYWYVYADGSYPTSCWKTIDGKDYYFKETGYLATSEYVKSSNYAENRLLYWVDAEGAWNKNSYQWKSNNKGWWIENVKSGAFPKKAWRIIDGKKYYFDKDGYMVTGKVRIGLKTYTFNGDGSLKE